jgi:GNAT superfamily N-acetyltransferase
MGILIRKVESGESLGDYLGVPGSVNDRPNRVLPLIVDERAFHDPRRNTALAECVVARFMAWQGEVPVGRIMCIIHPGHNAAHEERTARFYQLDCTNSLAIAQALLQRAEAWARERGMHRLIGPFGFSDKDPQGLQIEGFEHLPVIATPSNPSWLPPLVERCGYQKLIDAVSYRVNIPEVAPMLHERIAERALRNGRIRLLHFRSKRELKPWIVPVLRLVNETYTALFGFEPMSEQGMRGLAAQYMPILDPAFVQVIVDAQDAPVAFVVAAPDMSAGLRRAKGRLLPLGWWHILRAMKKSRQLDLFLGAVRPDLQGLGLTCVLGIALMKAARQRGLTHMDSHLVLETNHRMRAELERLGGTVWKRYRIYQKTL